MIVLQQLFTHVASSWLWTLKFTCVNLSCLQFSYIHNPFCLFVCSPACLSFCLSTFAATFAATGLRLLLQNMQRCAEADTAADQLRQQAECVGGEEARSMVQQLVGHVVTQKDKGRQAAAKVTEIVAMTI